MEENSKNGFRLVKVSLCQITALRVFSVAQNLGGAKFYPKRLTLSASNLGAKNTRKGHFWAWLLYVIFFNYFRKISVKL
jgi:hypothetical protein